MNRENKAGIFLFVLGLVALLKSLSYPLGNFRRPGGGFFPLFATVLLMALSAGLITQAFWQKKQKFLLHPLFSLRKKVSKELA